MPADIKQIKPGEIAEKPAEKQTAADVKKEIEETPRRRAPRSDRGKPHAKREDIAGEKPMVEKKDDVEEVEVKPAKTGKKNADSSAAALAVISIMLAGLVLFIFLRPYLQGGAAPVAEGEYQ